MSEISSESMPGGLSIVAVSGAADSAAGPELRDAIEAALADPDARLIVDLTYATFLDSAMLGTLAAGYERRRPQDGAAPRMAITCPQGNVRAMFEITALDTMLPIRDTVA